MEAVSFSMRDLNEINEHYQALHERVPLQPIRTQDDYDAAVSAMNALIDAGAADEDHPLAGLLGIVGRLVGDFDETQFGMPKAAACDVLRWLMDRHGLRQADLPEIGSQGIVSEVLSGKRDLNVSQIKRLSERFGIGPSAFL